LKYPYVENKHAFALSEQEELKKQFSDKGTVFSWQSSDMKAYFLVTRD